MLIWSLESKAGQKNSMHILKNHSNEKLKGWEIKVLATESRHICQSGGGYS